ncbi:MAG: hypothetical protein HY916_05155 [Desulfovibrio sp.]|jgi:hypothetical protein|nr:hypothetical protein [Desulfovibrio sp.]
MFTKAGLLIAILLVFVGYRWGKRKAQAAMQPPPAQAYQAAAPAAPRQTSWLSVRVLLIIVIILLIIAIFSSLQR